MARSHKTTPPLPPKHPQRTSGQATHDAHATHVHASTIAPCPSLNPSQPLFLCCSHPFLYFPTFYLMKGFVEDRPLESTYEAYRTELWDNCKALWKIWVPAQLVNFAVVPGHLRIPFGEQRVTPCGRVCVCAPRGGGGGGERVGW